ncbi:DNA repair protein RecN [Vaginisenegalia massiliensis]|uniref:DNA repair protein RecN n=1 Tax=Vaginisenegalia massiliensis TaxID=2058294 RepID=UPI000F522A64|nr:DNA repair protein RecN [Vaginisenegalia massiliensis]
MLVSLRIENFAIIEQLSIDFSKGMTVLSGETGAGKSIIIDALSILCGGRGSSDYIRTGEDKLVIEGQFAISSQASDLLKQLQDFGLDFDPDQEDLIIKREINQQGKNIIRVNGQLANVTLLKEIGTFLVDIHGQNEHQSLLNCDQHISLLDQFADQTLTDLKAHYHKAFQTYQASRRAWRQAQTKEDNQAQRLAFLNFQIQEIEAAHLQSGEAEELEALSQKLQHGQKINQNLQAINQLFSEDDQAVLTRLAVISDLLEEIAPYHEDYPVIGQEIQRHYYELQELAHRLAQSNGDLDLDSQTIDEVEGRLAEIGTLKRKYQMSVDELLSYYQTISEEVYQINHREQYMEQLSVQVQQDYRTAYEWAKKIHQQRIQLANELETAIKAEFDQLYMTHAQFKVQFSIVGVDSSMGEDFLALTEQGLDQIEFYVATNLGDSLKPLIKVASGGELSRFMLALKTVFSRRIPAQVMVFDEIDTGVSGRVAQAIAEKISSIGQNHQVLCITHLAQVAAVADQQVYIRKIVQDQRTKTELMSLDEDQRIEVIAQMMSGKDITPASLKLAQELRHSYQDNTK